MSSLCKTCKFADIAKKERTIVRQGVKCKQAAGGIICTCPQVHELTFNNGEMKCSDYKEV
jgi:hypothetical protein